MTNIKKMRNLFPSTLEQDFEKMSGAIEELLPLTVGIVHWNRVAEAVTDFRNELADRGLLQARDSIGECVDVVNRSLQQLSVYLKEPDKSGLDEDEASDLLDSIKTDIEELIQTAEEIDSGSK